MSEGIYKLEFLEQSGDGKQTLTAVFNFPEDEYEIAFEAYTLALKELNKNSTVTLSFFRLCGYGDGKGRQSLTSYLLGVAYR